MTGMPGPQHRFAGLPAILLACTALLVVVLIGGVGAEMYARHKADSLVADAVQCEAQDSATVSFAATPPVLAQYLNGHYPDISVQTAGNQIRSVKGMTVDIDLHDIRLGQGSGTPSSKGTIGSLDGTITWPTDGIKESIQDVVPMIGNLVAGSVTADPGAGTIEFKGLLDHATVKPQVVDNALALQVVDLSALGMGLDTDKVQSNLDTLTAKATKNLPLGIHVDSVSVTDTGLTVKFSAQNAAIPAGDDGSGSGDCFANL